MRRVVLASLAAVVVAGGCGEEHRLGPDAARAMHRDVDHVRAAAAAGDRAGGLRALDALDRRVSRVHEAGKLDDTAATELHDRIDAARRRLRREVPKPDSTSESTAVPTAPAPADAQGDEDQKEEEAQKKEDEGKKKEDEGKKKEEEEKKKEEEKGKEGSE